MRILVLGGHGMLGHQVVSSLAPRFEVATTVRRSPSESGGYAPPGGVRLYQGVDIRHYSQLQQVIATWRPTTVINAIGLIKQRPEANDPTLAIEVNALFPHRLAADCLVNDTHLIHLSTDCVFSGRRGGYTEIDLPDPVDLYGRSKWLGEIDDGSALTLRTSMIGLELSRGFGLVEWFLQARGRVKGFRRAVFSGLTTRELSRLLAQLLNRDEPLRGVYHVAAGPIDKYELLTQISDRLERTDIEIEPDDSVVCDRSLVGTTFANATGYLAPPWTAMLDELALDVRARQEQQVWQSV